jgi:uncharacterized membrane protein
MDCLEGKLIGMLNKIKSYILTSYKKIVHGIGFFPAVIALLFTLLAVVLLMIHDPDEGVLEAIPYLRIESAETARTLVAAILAGTISFIIFSFTMMMFVLNQAATNYSSKILEGLISKKPNQFILGAYIGTILYNIVSLMQIKKEDDFDKVPHLLIYVGILTFIFCIILFVQFINNIYNSVQIYNVIQNIGRETEKSLLMPKYEKKDIEDPDEKWHIYPTSRSGFYQGISEENILRIAVKNNLIIKSSSPFTYYHATGTPLFYLNKKIHDHKLLTNIEDTFLFYIGEDITDNPYYGIRQLSEVAVQSLSTGINAPGIAIACIDYLTQLLILWTNRSNAAYLKDGNGKLRVIVPEIPMEQIFEVTISPIRVYGKKDLNLLKSLIDLLRKFSYNDIDKRYQKLVKRHAEAIYEDAMKGLDNSYDKKSFEIAFKELKNIPSGYFSHIRLHN